jgi:hypothetical protein
VEQFQQHIRSLRLVVNNEQKSIVLEPQSAERLFTYTVNSEKRIVFVRFGHKLTVQDIADYAAALRGDPAFDSRFFELVDLSSVEEVAIDAEQALKLADHVDPFSLESKRAFVIHRPELFRAVRMHQILRSPAENIGIFGSIEEARQWLAGSC